MKFFRRLFSKLKLYFIELGHSISHPKESKRYDFKGMQTKHTCANCGLEYEGKFCPRCGQKAATQKLTPGNIISSVLEVGDFNNRSVIGTILELFYRPGYYMRDFLKGHRAPYYAPIKLLFFLCVILAIEVNLGIIKSPKKQIEAQKEISQAKLDSLAWVWAEDDFEDEDGTPGIADKNTALAQEAAKKSDDSLSFELTETEEEEYLKLKAKKDRVIGIASTTLDYQNKYLDWIDRNKPLYTLILNITLAFVCWFMFKRAPEIGRLSYTEHFFVQIYISCQLIVLAILILPFWQTSSGDLPIWILPVIMIWDFKQLFGISWGKSLGKTILTLIINGILTFFVFVVVAALIVTVSAHVKGIL
ncbi:MAG: DUF3667 domain-containing protein [Bacteroidales bacterium]|nr:DUF3667 domain-containing protein [Bacteroidales bacterium]